MRIKVVSPNQERAQQVAAIVRDSGPGFDVLSAASPISQLPEAVNGSRPSLLVLDGVDAHGLDAIGEFTQARPDVDMIIISSEQSPAFLLKAMQVGVREVLPPPIEKATLQAAVQRVARKRQPAQGAPEQGKVLAFMSCKGGSGATFLAANLAHVLSLSEDRTVGLIDLDLQFGDALLMLSDRAPASDVAEVARNITRLDAALLRAAMVQVSDTLSVLPAPKELTQALEVHVEHVDAIVRQARQMFDYVIIDIGRAINAVSLRALDAADYIFPVLQQSVPNVRDAKRVRDLFLSLGYPAHKIRWLVNRHQKNSEVTLDSMTQALGSQNITTVPNHFNSVSASVNQGVPIDKLARGNPVSRALLGLAHELAPVEKGRKEGWLNNLFGSH
jgi:pilus assembly protein CpaE